MKKYKIGVIVGSLRKESYNLKTAKALMEMAPESLSFEMIDSKSQEYIQSLLYRHSLQTELRERQHIFLRLYPSTLRIKKTGSTVKEIFSANFRVNTYF